MTDELPTHFECQECGYEGTVDELTFEGEMMYCPICDSPDFIWED